MTKEEWQRVEKSLSGTYGSVTLMVDSRKITLIRELTSANRLGIMTYVDGSFKGIWISQKEDYPEQRFLNRVDRFLFTAKQRAEWLKISKSKKGKEQANKKYTIYSPYWTSAAQLRRHYQKTFQNIELVEAIG